MARPITGPAQAPSAASTLAASNALMLGASAQATVAPT